MLAQPTTPMFFFQFRFNLESKWKVTMIEVSHRASATMFTFKEHMKVVIGSQPIGSPKWDEENFVAKLNTKQYFVTGKIEALLAKPLVGIYLVLTTQEESPSIAMEIKEIDVF